MANWDVAHEAAKLGNLFLAGGLSPDNITEAIEAVKPFAIDVNSGVERAPGIKDEKKLRVLAEKLAQKNAELVRPPDRV